ncbi:nuclear receptor coactivator 5 [Melitaea cinxia]|uniref:nuclear receptor coactivator 5 n=1 Tax=Melitaea cinxia TaxID=113334 RepID=UPI001E2732AC|nr:nuclear receptor coactivator 5 [Melitaea cinxia]
MADKLTLNKHAMKDKATAHLRIYVGGLTDDANVDELYNHFIEYGEIDGIVINRIFGFVQFRQESSAVEAIKKANGSVFQGKTITVRAAQRNGPKRETEVVTMQSDKPPAVALSTNLPIASEEATDEYDNYGNYVGEQSKGYREEEYDEGYNKPGWNERDAPPRGGPRGRASGRGRGRGAPPGFRERTPTRGGEWPDRNYDRYPQPEYPRALPVPERNDCEIIVVSKALTEYAEYIEGRLKRLGIVVDLLFPMEDVPIGKVLGNIASRGCLYAILVMPLNLEHRSLTLTILHGLPQEHRNMPLEDALQLLSRNFQEVQRGGPSGREAVYALLGQLADGRSLTVLQYDKVIEYLQERREQQYKIELGEPLTPAPTTNKTQVDLQQRILSILNEKKVTDKSESPPISTPPVNKQEPQSKLLNDPTVRKALDTILQKFV